MGAHSKVALLEARVEEREKEIESLLKSNNEQRTSTVHILQGLLDSEHMQIQTIGQTPCLFSYKLHRQNLIHHSKTSFMRSNG
ncbi:hypothetical protein CerSpe_205770 [Prunus speciosa]